MKRIVPFSLLLVFLFSFSCKKESNDNEKTSNSPNIIKLTINGKQYLSAAGKNFNSPTDHTFIESAMEKHSDSSNFYILIYGTSVDFNLMILTSTGPANGLGTFVIPKNLGSLTERFSGGEAYGIASGTLNVTKCEQQLIEGTIELTLKNSNRTKTVSGTFTIGEPHH